MIFLILLCVIISCSKNDGSLEVADNDAFINQLKSAPSVAIPKENFPKWLVEIINEYENSKEVVLYAYTPVTFYKGEWKKRSVYMIHDPLSSCIYCYVYYEDGTKIVFSPNSFDFQNTSRNWVLIWKIGGTEFNNT